MNFQVFQTIYMWIGHMYHKYYYMYLLGLLLTDYRNIYRVDESQRWQSEAEPSMKFINLIYFFSQSVTN